MGFIGVPDIMTQSFDDLSYSWQNDTTWGFKIVGKAKKQSEMVDEQFDIIKRLMEVTADFFIPTNIIYSLSSHAHDSPPFDEKHMEHATCKYDKELVDANGISVQRLKDDVYSVVIPEGQIRYIYEIFLYGRTGFILKDREAFINGVRETRLIPGDDKMFEKEVITRLFWITITHSEYAGDGHIAMPDDPAFYDIDFQTIAGIYFKLNDLGSANRKLLSSVFKKFYESFNVVSTNFRSDRYLLEGMESIASGDESFFEKCKQQEIEYNKGKSAF